VFTTLINHLNNLFLFFQDYVSYIIKYVCIRNIDDLFEREEFSAAPDAG
jgi:hypothetical protein